MKSWATGKVSLRRCELEREHNGRGCVDPQEAPWHLGSNGGSTKNESRVSAEVAA